MDATVSSLDDACWAAMTFSDTNSLLSTFRA